MEIVYMTFIISAALVAVVYIAFKYGSIDTTSYDIPDSRPVWTSKKITRTRKDRI